MARQACTGRRAPILRSTDAHVSSCSNALCNSDGGAEAGWNEGTIAGHHVRWTRLVQQRCVEGRLVDGGALLGALPQLDALIPRARDQVALRDPGNAEEPVQVTLRGIWRITAWPPPCVAA